MDWAENLATIYDNCNCLKSVQSFEFTTYKSNLFITLGLPVGTLVIYPENNYVSDPLGFDY